LLITITLSLIVVLYILKRAIVVLPLRKNDSARILNLYKRGLQVAKALFDKTLLLKSNISLNKLRELILL